MGLTDLNHHHNHYRLINQIMQTAPSCHSGSMWYWGTDISPGQFPLRILPPDNSPSDNSPSQLGQFPPVPIKTQLENYINTYMYAHLHTYIHTCIYTYIYSCIHIHLYIVIYID